MKFFLSIIALTFVSLFFTSGFTSHSYNIGDKAPDFSLNSDSSEFTLSGERGTKVLITFWSVTDAESRCDCNRYAAALTGSDIKHIAINLDQNSSLYHSVLKADNLQGNNFYSPEARTASRITQRYALDGHCGSILISESGIITAFNPEPESLRKR